MSKLTPIQYEVLTGIHAGNPITRCWSYSSGDHFYQYSTRMSARTFEALLKKKLIKAGATQKTGIASYATVFDLTEDGRKAIGP